MATVTLLDYSITIEPGLLDRVGDIARAVAPAHRYAIITDDTVAPLYLDRVVRSIEQCVGPGRCIAASVPGGEAFKTRDSWARLTDTLLDAHCGRDTTIIALGGGVVGDLAGFVAATFMRGIPFIQAPTTLLAMIDASVGGKTGVDTPAGKNLVGAFHQPAAVLIDPTALDTLSRRHLRAGLAEAIKHGIIADRDYLDIILATLPKLLEDAAGAAGLVDLITRGVTIKADVVERDVREGGLRKVLNFGHTIGHAVESLSGYTLLHGEAISIGMTLEARLAERLAIAEEGTADAVRAALNSAELPTRLPDAMTADSVLAETKTDKKARGGQVEYALPRQVGVMAGESSGWAIPVEDEDVLAVLCRG